MNTSIHGEFAGRYHLQVIRADGTLRQEIEFNNLITNQGLDWVYQPPTFAVYGGTGKNLSGFCCVGTGTTPPANTDTKLGTFGTFASVYGNTSIIYSYIAGSPSIWQYVTTTTFPAGTATGTWSEIGVGPVGPPGALSVTTEPSGPYLFSHALIVDGGGSPTTISVLSTEQLVVTYTLQLYITNTDVSYPAFLINTTSTTGTLRPTVVSSVQGSMPAQGASGQTSFNVYSGSLGTYTGSPSGATVASGLTSASGYSSGSYFCSLSATWSASAPLVNTWTVVVANSMLGNYQFSLSPPVVIGAGASFSLTVNVSWARH